MKVLHIGGYVGEEAPLYQSMGHDFTFVEAVPEYAEGMRKKGYKVIECAVGADGGLIDFYVRAYASSYLPHKKGGKKIKVMCYTLGHLLEIEHKKGNEYDMLVIDAQGATYDILESGSLSGFDTIVCEVSQHPRYKGERSMKAVMEFLELSGFYPVYIFKHVGNDIYDMVYRRTR